MVPSYPDGSTVDSMLIALHRVSAGNNYGRSRSRFYRQNMSGDSNANVLGRHARTLSVSAFKERISATDLVLKHSAWPVFSRLLPPALAQAEFEECLAGAVPTTHLKVRSTKDGRPFAKCWRSCRTCITEDRATFGTGHWRVIHQLPGVVTCPTHGQVLQDRCICGTPLGGPRLDALPGEPCLACGSSKPKTQRDTSTAGSIALGKLYETLIAGGGPALDAFSRSELHRRASNSEADDSVGQRLAGFRRFFGCTATEQLSQRLGVEVTHASLRSTLGGKTAVCSPIVHFALAAYALQLPEYQHTKVLWTTSPQSDDGGLRDWHEPGSRADRFLEAARSVGFPEVAARLILNGTPARVLNQHLFPLIALNRLRAVLSSDLQDLVAAPQPKVQPPKEKRLSKEMSAEQVRSIHRDRMVTERASGALTRAALNKRCSPSYKWCLKNDAQWLDELVPQRGIGGRPRVRKSDAN